jgi:predicted ATP-dependent endonuclease of OLD family
LIDEVEHGLEPHRLARLLKYLKQPKEDTATTPQIFMTTHSTVAIRELAATELYAVCSRDGVTAVRNVGEGASDPNTVQAHMRATPEAFLARRILIGEGRTEEGLLRGLDSWWTSQGKDSLAVQGVVVVSGNGKDKAPMLGAHLRTLGYGVLLLLDSDKPPDPVLLQAAKDNGAVVHQWPGNTSTELRMLMDLEWATLRTVVRENRSDAVTEQSAVDSLNNHLLKSNLPKVTDLSLPAALDSQPFRKALGAAAADKDWFKTIGAGERIAATVGPTLERIASTPFAAGVSNVRLWIDG